MHKIKVGLSALHYPVTMARYFWDALDRRDDVEVYAVGPFFGDFIPWKFGMTIPHKYVKTPYLCLPQMAAKCHMPYEMVAGEMPDDLDLFLTIDAGWHFSTRPKANVTVLIKTDPHVLPPQYYAQPKAYSDISYSMQTPYIDAGDFYLPYAYDPIVHYPMDLPKEYDACLIGLQYPQRADLVKRLRKLGMKVFFETGLVYDEYREIYAKSRIALSWSSLEDLPARVWEAFAMGVPLVTNRVPDLNNFFVEGEHYLGFTHVDEGVDQVVRLMANPELAQGMADNALRKVRNHHTWDARIEQILHTAKLIL